MALDLLNSSNLEQLAFKGLKTFLIKWLVSDLTTQLMHRAVRAIFFSPASFQSGPAQPGPSSAYFKVQIVWRIRREYYQKCSVLYCVTQLCTIICTLIRAVLRAEPILVFKL